MGSPLWMSPPSFPSSLPPFFPPILPTFPHCRVRLWHQIHPRRQPRWPAILKIEGNQTSSAPAREGEGEEGNGGREGGVSASHGGFDR